MFTLSRLLFVLVVIHSNLTLASMRFIQVEASQREQRSEISNHGMSIEFIRSDSVWGFANESSIKKLTASGFKVLSNLVPEIARGGHGGATQPYHTFEQIQANLQAIALKNPDLAQLQSIGKSIENRDLWALHLNSSPEALRTGISQKPGVLFIGNHHAREHLSVEVPLKLAEFLLEHRNEAKIAQLLETRDIWIVPMVNPDGAEFDFGGKKVRFWRKNRRNNQDGSFGVDLNRNYGFQWGTEGSETDTSSDLYRGQVPFSEPETQAVRDFVELHANLRSLLTFHSYGELILYPWGYTTDPIENPKDLAVFQKMANTMANWNHYRTQQNSELYTASGDTTDWAYGAKGIFAFTFELSPTSFIEGGFYPDYKIIERVFNDNLNPCLYFIEMAGNPYQVLESAPSVWLSSTIDPGIEPQLLREFTTQTFY